jgi:23S rRNA G2445 N2-methylase RlmL
MRRDWPFMTWHDFDATAWATARSAAVQRGAARRAALAASGHPHPRILGADIHPRAVELARASLAAAGLASAPWLSLERADVRDWAPAAGRVTHVVVNPPWGGRLQSEAAVGEGGGADSFWRDPSGEDWAEAQPLSETWFQLGAFLKRRAAGATAAVLCGNRGAANKLFLSPRLRHPLTVGGLETRLLLIDLLPPKREPGGMQQLGDLREPCAEQAGGAGTGGREAEAAPLPTVEAPRATLRAEAPRAVEAPRRAAAGTFSPRQW